MFIALLGFIVGTFLGSLGYCLALRSLSRETFLGRSYCPGCKSTLRWYDLIPLLSFILTSGKCRYCRKKISKENLFWEIIFGVLISFLFYQQIPRDVLALDQISLIFFATSLIFQTFIICILVIVLITDFKKGLIPDRITLPATIFAFSYILLMVVYRIFLFYEALKASEIGQYLLPPNSSYFQEHALIAAAPLITGIYSAVGLAIFFGSIIFFTKGRGMGGGDFKLAIFIGLVLGFPNALVAVVLAFLTGSAVAIALLLKGKKKFGQTIAFGPFLSLGALIALFWADKIITWYINLKFIS